MTIRRGLRALAAHPGQAVGLLLLTAVAVGFWCGGHRARASLLATRAAVYQDLALADLEIRCAPCLPGDLAPLADTPGVEALESRLLAVGILSVDGREDLAAVVHLLPASGVPQIGRMRLVAGRMPLDGEAAAVVDRSALRLQGVEIGDRVDVAVEGEQRRLTVVGAFLSPEQLLTPANPSLLLPVRGTLAILAVSPAAAEGIEGTKRVNSVLFTLEEGADADAVQEELLARFPASVTSVIPASRAPDRVFTDMVLRTFDTYLPASVTALCLVVLLLLACVVTRIVARGRREFGVLMALGHRPASIAGAYVVFTVVPVVVGAALGILVHGPYARRLAGDYAASIGFPPIVDAGPPTGVGFILAAVLLAAAATSLVPAVRLLRLLPAAALRPRERQATLKPPGALLRGMARLRGHLRLPVSVVLGFTHVVRRRGDTIAAALGLGSAFALVLAFLLVHHAHREEVFAAQRGATLDALVHLDRLGDAARIEELARAGDGRAVPFLAVPAHVQTSDHAFAGRIEGMAPERLAAIEISRGRPPDPNAAELLIDHWTAAEEGIDVGASLFVAPGRDSPDGGRFTVVGIARGVSFGRIVMPLARLQQDFGLGGLFGGAHVSSALPAADLKRALWQGEDVAAVYARDDALRSLVEGFEPTNRILEIGVLLAALVAVLFLGILAALDAADRGPALSVLYALGWRRRSLLAIPVTEVLARTVLAVGVAALLGPWLAGRLVARLEAVNHYPIDVTPAPGVALVVLGTALALAPLGAVPSFLRAARMSPGRALRFLSRD